MASPVFPVLLIRGLIQRTQSTPKTNKEHTREYNLKHAAQWVISTGRAYLACAPLFFLLCATLPGREVEARSVTYQLDIPSEDLQTALQAFALACHHKLLYRADLVVGKTSHAITGTFTTEEAVHQLLSGTGLSFTITSTAVVLIKSESNGAGAGVLDEVSKPQRADRVSAIAASPSPPVFAQSPASGGTQLTGQNSSSEDVLGEIQVTATRYVDSVNRVPLSMTALTAKALDAQGITTVEDITRVVPGLTLRFTDNAALNPEIRGIVSTSGAPTTGIYIDDTALQQRAGGGLEVGNGTPFPPLFDLERVEVLRGPQGTLFGGSSEGGTVRFITPTPSLTDYSMYSKAEVGAMYGGIPSYELGVAGGGPIIQNELGFRLSVYDRRIGGDLDHVNQYTEQVTASNTNTDETRLVRGALAWTLADDVKLTAAALWSRDDLADASPFWVDQPAVATPARYYSATSATPLKAPYSGAVYAYPAQTYGPYDFYGPSRAGENGLSPADSALFTPSLTADVGFHGGQLKNILSYVSDTSQGVSVQNASPDIASLQAGVPYIAQLPNFPADFGYSNTRRGLTEELRFSSDWDIPVRLVSGLYYAEYHTHSVSAVVEDLDAATEALMGLPASVKYGAGLLPGDIASSRDQTIDQRELAAYAQADWKIIPKLDLTVGERVSGEDLHYFQVNDGPVSGYGLTKPPTLTNGGIVNGTEKSTPVTPKFGLEYEITPADIVYVSAAKGFREGGVNTQLPSTCAASEAAAGYTSGAPTTYSPDTLWSYELGAKVRLFDRVQLNASAFYIDWSGIQFSVSLPGCAIPFVTNAAKAVSKGFDAQASVVVVGGLTADFAAAYTDAYYSQQVNVRGSKNVLIDDGDRLATPSWSTDFGAQYTYEASGYSIYLRGDYEWKNAYQNGTGPGTTSYNPDTFSIPETHYANARLGSRFNGWDVSVFAKNLTNSQDILGYSGINLGRYGCSATTGAACSTYADMNPAIRAYTYRPREIGLTAIYRY